MSEEKRAFAVRQNSDGTLNVLAEVQGDAALEMVENAEKSGMPVVQNSYLADTLEEVAVTQEVLAWELMSVLVVEIESFVEELDSNLGKGKK